MSDSKVVTDTPVEIDVNTDNLDDFSKLFSGEATEAKEVEEAPVEDEPVELAPPVDDEAEDAESDPDETADEPEAEADADEDEPEEDVLPKRKNRKTAKERITELTSEIYLERRAREQSERRLEEMERQLKTREPVPEAKPVADSAPHPDARDKDDNLIYPLGEFDPTFIRDLTSHTLKQQMAEFKANQEQEAAERSRRDAAEALQKGWDTKLTEAQKDLDDLLPTIGKLESELRGIDPQMGVFLSEVVMGMDLGPQVLYYLASNPGEATRIASLNPPQAAISLGRLEAKIESVLKKPPKSPSRQTTAPDPAPSAPRGNTGRTAVKPDTDNLDDFSKLFFEQK